MILVSINRVTDPDRSLLTGVIEKDHTTIEIAPETQKLGW